MSTKAWPPRFVSPDRGRRTDGDGAIRFVEAHCRQTSDSVAGRVGDSLVLRDWQERLIRKLYRVRGDGRRKYRQALVGLPRKNGKSVLGSALALDGLFMGPDGAEVYSCAADREQARIVFGIAKRMVELDPEMTRLARPYRDAIEFTETGSVYRVLSSEAFTKEGLSPTLVIFDEVHAQPNGELWHVMNLGSGARENPLVLGITTAGVRVDRHGEDTLCYQLYQYGRRVAAGELEDDSFFFAWWEPKAGADSDHTDPKVWAEANPGFDDLIDPEDFDATVRRTPEAEFRTKRTNLWVVSADAAIPHGAWDRCAAPELEVPDGAEVVLFCDGSWSGDSTGVVGCTVPAEGEVPHLFTVGVWERPPDDRAWRVPIVDVKAALHEACRRWHVAEADFDPYRWQHTMAELADEGIPIVEFQTGSAARIVPAWKHFYDVVLDELVTQDGNPTLARHIENMRLKIDAKGPRPVKESKASSRHIDLGICAVGSLARASALSNETPAPAPMFMAAYR